MTKTRKKHAENEKINLTDDSIVKSMLLFSLPMMLGNFLQQIYNIADMFIVGHFVGSDALAAVGAAYTLMTFLTSLVIGLCMGSGAIFSKWYGAGKTEEMKQDIKLSFGFIGIVTIVIILIIYPCTDGILHLLSVPDDIYMLMRAYVRIIFAGMFFTFLYNFFAYLLRSTGNAVAPLYFLFFSSVLNIALDLYFVVALRAGTSGAAVATVISQGIAGIGITIYTLHKMPDTFGSRQKFKWSRMKAIIKNDIATGMQQSVMNFGILMIQGLVNSFGTVIIAAFAAAVKIDTFAYMPSQEFGNAYSLFVSQNYGAKKKERILKGTKAAMLVSTVFCFGISALIWILSEPLMKLFVDGTNTEIISEGVNYLRIEGSFYFGIGFLFLLYGFYRGIQKAEMSFVLTVISLGTRVALAYMLAPSAGVMAIWWAIPVGWLLADTVGLVYYKKIRNGII